MTEDERHDRSHARAEEEIGDILWDIFADSERICRATVLLKILHDELMQMDDAQDVSDTITAMTRLVLERTIIDRELLDTVGSA
jgi:hypothetical protein